MGIDSRSFIVVAHHLAIEGFSALAAAFDSAGAGNTRLLVLSNSDLCKTDECGKYSGSKNSYEQAFRSGRLEAFSLDDLYRRYPRVAWGAIVAAERSFTDYSFTFGGTGHRTERSDYIVPLLLRMVAFFDEEYERLKPDVVITAFGDNIFTLIATVVAEEKGISVLLPQSAFLNESGLLEAGYFANSRFLESYAMVRCYLDLKARALTDEERSRAKSFADTLVNYDGAVTLAHIYKKKDFEKPVTPQRSRLITYLREQMGLDSNIEFYKVDPLRKFNANLLRVIRQRRVSRFLEKQPATFSKLAVFYPMHYQPEASTLINGVWYSNQVALIENLSKALPVGYTLVVKEHPRGRGVRPLWQYEYIASLHNVQFCDRPSKEILRESELVVSISGSIGLEALAMRKPVLMLGRTFHTFNSLYFRVGGVEELPEVLRRILLDREFYKNPTLDDDIYRFLLAYIMPMYDFFPVGIAMAGLVSNIVKELEQDEEPSKRWIDAVLNRDTI